MKTLFHWTLLILFVLFASIKRRPAATKMAQPLPKPCGGRLDELRIL